MCIRDSRVDLRSELLDEGAELVDGLLEVAPLFAQEGSALAELGALRLGEGVHGADALAPAAQPLEALAQLPRFVVVRRRGEPGLVQLLADLVEGGGDLGAAVLEARQRHLDGRAPLAEVGQVATQAGLPLGQRAQLTTVERRLGLLARVEALDERLGVPAQSRDPRRERLADLAHLRQLLEAALELLQPRAPGGGAAPCRFTLLGGALRSRAPLLQLDAAARHQRCLLYTSDAADDLLCVDLGGRRII